MNTKRDGVLVVLACHGVFDLASNQFYGEHSCDRPIYEAQLSYAFKHLEWRRDGSPLLVISGGATKKQLRCSESESYLQMAGAMGLTVPANVALEKFGLTSIENVLFSLYVYSITRGYYPVGIEVISWEFKRMRFEQTLDAINRWERLGPSWPKLNFFPVGDLCGRPKQKALEDEEDYSTSLRAGMDAYYENPKTQGILKERDVYSCRPLARQTYARFPMPF